MRRRTMRRWIWQAMVLMAVAGGCGPSRPAEEPGDTDPRTGDAAPSKEEVDDVIDGFLADDGGSAAGTDPKDGPTSMPTPKPATSPRPTPSERPAPSKGQASWRPGRFMQMALHNLVRPCVKLMEEGSFGFEGGTTIVGAFLEEGRKRDFRRPFESGKKYVFVGAASDAKTDIDLQVRNAEGKLLAQDNQDDGLPVVVFTPPETATYTITLGSAKGTGFVAFSTMCEACLRIPPKRIDDAVIGMIQKAGAVSNALMRSDQGGLVFSERDWAFFSTVLEQGRETGFTVDMGGSHVFMASGDESSLNLDLELRNPEGQVLKADHDGDAVPGFRHGVPRGRHQVVVQAPRTNGKSLVSVLVLTVSQPK
ncbi:MAG: hypothetical protein AAGN82_10410 [Myxococcota bacterium]